MKNNLMKLIAIFIFAIIFSSLAYSAFYVSANRITSRCDPYTGSYMGYLINGSCGYCNNRAFSETAWVTTCKDRPVNLCSSGKPVLYSGSNTGSWLCEACTNIPGRVGDITDMSCHATINLTGECGSTKDSCTKGTWRDDTDTCSLYKWFCDGSGSGSTASCSSDKPNLVETCDGSDNDCDTIIDEDFNCASGRPNCIADGQPNECTCESGFESDGAGNCVHPVANFNCGDYNLSPSNLHVSSPTGITNGSAYPIGDSENITFEWDAPSFGGSSCRIVSGFNPDNRNGIYLNKQQIGGDHHYDSSGGPSTYNACIVGPLPYPTPLPTYSCELSYPCTAPPYTTVLETSPFVIDGYWFTQYRDCVGNNCMAVCEKQSGEKIEPCVVEYEYRTSPSGNWVALPAGATTFDYSATLGENYFGLRSVYGTNECDEISFTFTGTTSTCGDGILDPDEECDGTTHCIAEDEIGECTCDQYSTPNGTGQCIPNPEECNGLDDDGDTFIDEDFYCPQESTGCDENCEFETTPPPNSIIKLGGQIIEIRRIAAVIECLYNSTVMLELKIENGPPIPITLTTLDEYGNPLTIDPPISNCNNEPTAIDIRTNEDLSANTTYILTATLQEDECLTCEKLTYLEDTGAIKGEPVSLIPDNNPLIILLLLLSVSIILTRKDYY